MKHIVTDVTGISGFALLVVGIWQTSPSAAVATAGGILMAAAVCIAVRDRNDN